MFVPQKFPPRSLAWLISPRSAGRTCCSAATSGGAGRGSGRRPRPVTPAIAAARDRARSRGLRRWCAAAARAARRATPRARGARHILFLDGVYVERAYRSVRFRWVKAPTSTELTHLAQIIARRVGRFLSWNGRDCWSGMPRTAIWLEKPWKRGRWISCWVTLLPTASPWARSKGARCSPKAPTVDTLQTLPACDEPFDDPVGKVAGFSLHAGVAAKAHERKKLERLCRYRSPDRPYPKSGCH